MDGFLTVLFAALLGASAMQGGAQPTDCRSCHAPGATSGARDFSHIYRSPAQHHAVGLKYPADTNDGFHRPNGSGSGLTFFDSNGNGQPDRDEIRLFGTGNAATVECATCHQEHGAPNSPASAARKYYLRVDNARSALCATCHDK